MGVRSTLSCGSPDAILPTHPATDEPGSTNVILLRKPSDERIGRFLDDQRSLPFSYPEVGATRDGAPPGYPVNQLRGWLGAGRETFARAVEASGVGRCAKRDGPSSAGPMSPSRRVLS